MTTRLSLQKSIGSYQSSYFEEIAFQPRFISLLNNQECFSRRFMPGHMTGSAWILDYGKKHVLLTHHAKLNRWLQPGGHADGDENILSVALREAQEETGIHSLGVEERIFDLDIHSIPAKGDIAEHLHYDVRILMYASKEEKLMISDESHDLAWVSLDEVGIRSGNNASILRMAEKSRSL